MARAAILIGVDRTGGGQHGLSDAAAGARKMQEWALSQGMAPEHVHCFTDEAADVTIAPIKKAVRALVDAGNIEQLIVYFAGHGVNIRYGEYWLLSDAPIDSSAAVNLEGSIVLARRCGIPHVVFVSDACRTAAEGIQAQGVTGSELFPNDPVDGVENAVDVFFAATLGRPALEVKDVGASSQAYRAVYTSALLDAVSGRLHEALHPAQDGKRPGYTVRPRRLKACLQAELPRRLSGLKLGSMVNQTPDARITSDEEAWVAGFDVAPPGLRGAVAAMSMGDTDDLPSGSSIDSPEVTIGRSIDLPTATIGGSTGGTRFKRTGASIGGGAKLSQIRGRTGGTAAHASRSGPAHSPSDCGVRVRGGTLSDFFSRSGVRVERLDHARVRIDDAVQHEAAVPVAVVFHDGTGILVPVMRGFIADLTMEDGEVTKVAYDPIADQRDDSDVAETYLLRAIIALEARAGVLRLETRSGQELARSLRVPQGIDPALALYGAYAYHQLQQLDRIDEMRRALRADVGVSFFDLELLARALPRGTAPAPSSDGAADFLPPFPMLAQGWALLPAFGVRLSEQIQALRGELVDALWTQFTPAGVSRLRGLMQAGEI